MRKTIAGSLFAGLVILASLPASAQFFDTSVAERTLSFGVRAGFNTSNLSSPEYSPGELGLMRVQTNDTWGAGFTCGAVVDINFRRWLTIQPGIFFETRSNRFSYLDYAAGERYDGVVATFGKTSHTSFRIPVVVSGRFNVGRDLRWSVDLGPFFSFGAGGKEKGHNLVGVKSESESEYVFSTYKGGYFDTRRKFDCGYKVGTGLQFREKYYIGAHYEQGLVRPWKNLTGGHHKSWSFTLGYDF